MRPWQDLLGGAAGLLAALLASAPAFAAGAVEGPVTTQETK